MSFEVLELYTDKSVTQGPDVGEIRRYVAHRSRDGYPVYKLMPGPRRSEDIEFYVDTLSELWEHVSAGRKTRFDCAEVVGSAPVVLGIDENHFHLKVSKASGSVAMPTKVPGAGSIVKRFGV